METKKYRGGAPKKADSEKRDRLVKVLFNEAEFNRLAERKSTTKAPNLSDFIRSVCLDKPLKVKPQLSTHQENVLSLIREMRSDVLRIGVNINQSAKRINSTTDYYELRAEVSALAENMAKIDFSLGGITNAILVDKQLGDIKDQSSDGC